MACVTTSPCSGPCGGAKEGMSVDSACRAGSEAYGGVRPGRLGGDTEPRMGSYTISEALGWGQKKDT